MGKKIAGVYWMVSFVAVIVQTISVEMRWHSLRYMTGLTTSLHLMTGLLFAKGNPESSMVCKIPGARGACKSMEDGVSLQEASHMWCAPAITRLYPQPCDAFTSGFYVGILVVAAMALNAIALLVAGYFVWRYQGGVHKKSDRETAFYIHLISTMALMAAVILFHALVISKLDDIAGTGIFFIAQASHGTGISYGYFAVWIGLIVQIVAGVLVFYITVGDEQTEDERQEYLLQKDLAAYEQSLAGKRPQAGVANATYASTGYGQHALPQPMGQGHGQFHQAVPGYGAPFVLPPQTGQLPLPAHYTPPPGTPQRPAW